MGQHLLRTFFNRQKDDKDPLYMALDCWEQVIYKALKSYDLNYKYIFVKDIYPIFIEYKNSWSLLLPEIDSKRSIYEEKHVDFSFCGPCTAIENLINQNRFVVIHTAFDLIPAYNKQEITVSGRTHYSIIVGYDHYYFYVIDNPFMFNKSKNRTHPGFPNISLIDKIVMNKAFEKKCVLKTIHINIDSLTSIKNIDLLISKIVNNFYSQKIDRDGNHDLFYGRKAFLKLIQALENSSFECLKNSFLNNHYNAHLLYSCRLILKWCLEEDIRYQNNIYYFDIIRYLEEGMEKWQVVKMMIAKNNAKLSPDFLDKLKGKIVDILEIEEKLIENMSELSL